MNSLGGQQLLRKDGAVVQADEALTDKKIIAFYFSAHWCPPCRLFTPVLAEFYSDLSGAAEPIEIVFVSSDKTAEELLVYMRESHGDWLAVQHGTVLARELQAKYDVTGIPSLVVTDRDGRVICKNGRSEVTDRGPQAFQSWIAASN